MVRGYIFTFASIDQNTVMGILAASSSKSNSYRSNLLSSKAGASDVSIQFIKNSF